MCVNVTLGISLIRIADYNGVITLTIFCFGCGFCVATLMIQKFGRYILLWESPVDWCFCCTQPGTIWRAVVLEKSLPPSLGKCVVSKVLYISAANKVDNLLRLGKDHYLSIGNRLRSIALILIQWLKLLLIDPSPFSLLYTQPHMPIAICIRRPTPDNTSSCKSSGTWHS